MSSSEVEQAERFVPVADADELNKLFELSNSRPVIIFKHSLTCPISSAAYEEMSGVSEEVSLLVIQRARDLSREVESRTGVRHESPQAIILRNGLAVWNASHWNVTSAAVESAAREHQ